MSETNEPALRDRYTRLIQKIEREEFEGKEEKEPPRQAWSSRGKTPSVRPRKTTQYYTPSQPRTNKPPRPTPRKPKTKSQEPYLTPVLPFTLGEGAGKDVGVVKTNFNETPELFPGLVNTTGHITGLTLEQNLKIGPPLY
jgi:hypothetical protein